MKECFILTLLVTFFLMFGYPSWRKYSAGGIVTARKMTEMGKIEAPAITVCPQDKLTKQGWKGAKPMRPPHFLERLCNASDNMSLLSECIENKSYKLHEIFQNVSEKIEDFKIDLFSNQTDWKANIGFFPYGKCYTYNSSLLVGTHRKNAVKGDFITRRNFVFLHDPQFFFATTNPNTVPRIFLDINEEDGITAIYIKVTKHKKVNNLFDSIPNLKIFNLY